MRRVLPTFLFALASLVLAGCDSRMPPACMFRLSALKACRLAVEGADLIAAGRDAEADRALTRAMLSAPDEDVRQSIAEMANKDYAARAAAHGDAGAWSAAIASYTLALKYDPEDAASYEARAYADIRALKFNDAVADYDAVLRIGGPKAIQYIHRGGAHEMNLDFDGALADYDAAMRLDPHSDNAAGYRGRLYAALGQYENARRDLESQLKDTPDDMSTTLWLHIVHMRLHENDAKWLRTRGGALGLESWPGPAISYFLGDKTSDALLEFAWTSPETASGYQRCDGWFYLGEEALARGDNSAARTLLRQTVANCDAVDYEWDMAQAELRRLKL